MFLEIALEKAKESIDFSNLPVWAVITVDDEILWESHNETAQKWYSRYHAETVLMNRISDNNKIWIKKVFVTFEPCKKCSNALRAFWINEIHYIIDDPFWGWTKDLSKDIKVFKHSKYEQEYINIIISHNIGIRTNKC